MRSHRAFSSSCSAAAPGRVGRGAAHHVLEIALQVVPIGLGDGQHPRGVHRNVAAPAQRQLQALHLFVAQFFHRGAQLLHPHQAQRQDDHQGQHGHPGQQADLLGNGQPVEPLGGMRGVFRH